MIVEKILLQRNIIFILFFTETFLRNLKAKLRTPKRDFRIQFLFEITTVH